MGESMPVRITVDIIIDSDDVNKLRYGTPEVANRSLLQFFKHSWGHLCDGPFDVQDARFVNYHLGPVALETIGEGSARDSCNTCADMSVDSDH